MAELQEEMARGATALEELSAQLEEERLRTNPVAIKSSLQKVIYTSFFTHRFGQLMSILTSFTIMYF